MNKEMIGNIAGMLATIAAGGMIHKATKEYTEDRNIIVKTGGVIFDCCSTLFVYGMVHDVTKTCTDFIAEVTKKVDKHRQEVVNDIFEESGDE